MKVNYTQVNTEFLFFLVAKITTIPIGTLTVFINSAVFVTFPLPVPTFEVYACCLS